MHQLYLQLIKRLNEMINFFKLVKNKNKQFKKNVFQHGIKLKSFDKTLLQSIFQIKSKKEKQISQIEKTKIRGGNIKIRKIKPQFENQNFKNKQGQTMKK